MPTDNEETLGERVRIARQRSGLSQDAVAKRLGLQRPAVSEIEAGRRKVKSAELALLADIFHVSMEWLASGKGDSPSKLEVAARGLSKLKEEDLDKILNLLKTLRDPDVNS
jgi:transcriptional regulator with XRE-family HTH domain